MSAPGNKAPVKLSKARALQLAAAGAVLLSAAYFATSPSNDTESEEFLETVGEPDLLVREDAAGSGQEDAVASFAEPEPALKPIGSSMLTIVSGNEVVSRPEASLSAALSDAAPVPAKETQVTVAQAPPALPTAAKPARVLALAPAPLPVPKVATAPAIATAADKAARTPIEKPSALGDAAARIATAVGMSRRAVKRAVKAVKPRTVPSLRDVVANSASPVDAMPMLATAKVMTEPHAMSATVPTVATAASLVAIADDLPGFFPRRPDKPVPDSKVLRDDNLDLNVRSGLVPVPPVRAWAPTEGAPVPDRWRIVNNLKLLKENSLDPYNQNTLKGDKPIIGNDGFLTLGFVADSIWEPRRVPTPVAPQSTTRPTSNDIFGGSVQNVLATSVILPWIYIKGDTAFRPPDYELHFTPVFNFNSVQVEESRALRVDPRESRARRETFIGVQELFIDYHLRNVSDRYDFDSIRFGIQPIALDFRGFLFQDLPISLRLFGNRDNNLWQYNLIWARRLEKDTNSLLNSINQKPRDDDVFAANLYRQDWPVLGFTTQGTIVHNVNREGQDVYYNRNGFIERPGSFGLEKGRNYQVTYFGLNGDGHFGRTNLTASAYLALGRESRGAFVEKSRQITAGFAAAEVSWDFDWTRLRLSALYATPDNDPFDGSANGFDAINELPLIAGADTSYYIRQSVPLIGGGGVALTTRNGVLNNLRTSIQHGQSNFSNPGTVLLGVGTDFDITPRFRISTNVNYLRFADSTTVEVARNQGNIPNEIGYDVSIATIWRPFATQNIVIRTSYAELFPGEGYNELFPHQRGYSFLANLIFTY